MGYHAHDAIVVTSWDRKRIEPAHLKAREIFGEQVSEITPKAVNGFMSFFVPPDGSKEWWAESDEGDKRRAAFIDWMRNYAEFVDFVAVRFGGDFGVDHGPEITAHR